MFCTESSFLKKKTKCFLYSHLLLPKDSLAFQAGKCQVTWSIFLEKVKVLPVVGGFLSECEIGTLRGLTCHFL